MSNPQDTGSEASPGGLVRKKGESEADFASRRRAVRLTTVFSGKIYQYGKAYECVISDVSVGGAKVRLKNPLDFPRITKDGEVQLVFERLSDYKALNSTVAWLKADEHVVGLTFVDPELRRRVVIKKLMPNRWRIANEQDVPSADDEAQDKDSQAQSAKA